MDDPTPPATAPVTDEAVWLERHIDVLFDTDARGRLTRLNEPEPETEAPRVFLARGRRSSRIRFRDDVPDEVADTLARIAADVPAWHGGPPNAGELDEIRRAVHDALSSAEESAGPAYRFTGAWQGIEAADVVLIDSRTAHLLEPHFPYTRSVLEARGPVVAVVREGAVVSACYSARRRDTAAEAGVDTIEPFRGAGLAALVVAGWARAAADHGLVPLYSTSWDNAASLRVATKLRLQAYADTVAFA